MYAAIALACSSRIPLILRYISLFFLPSAYLPPSFHLLIFLYFSPVSSESISKCVLHVTDSVFCPDKPDFTTSNVDFDDLITIEQSPGNS